RKSFFSFNLQVRLLAIIRYSQPSNPLYYVTSMIFRMNKTLITSAIVFVFATALVVIGSGAIQSVQACPNTSSGTATPNANQTTTNNLNTQQLPSQLTTGQA
ncbi:MAG: hypothetical protein WBE34_15545, partial [Candidatus Nitrosopolaris sp.]